MSNKFLKNFKIKNYSKDLLNQKFLVKKELNNKNIEFLPFKMSPIFYYKNFL